ncbi:FusB/FusC family EF-G-binding protein [Rummeliibacillus sp. NPDC094406]|uniref:FusB/FusC family EF-G-binding protein n=1 Tax=Rummeliibacillus sp. NPDC094406 TaxID=3364511 RepID=UPI0038086DCD
MEKQTIQPFLSVANYHLIEQQMNKIINTHHTTKDKNVILAVKGLVETELSKNLELDPNQLIRIEQLYNMTDYTQGELYLERLKPYVIPFREVTVSNLKSLFKKEKKLKLPNLESIDFQHICYLTWDDVSTHRKYVVLEQREKLKAIKGNIDTKVIKGICAVCNRHSDVSLFTTKVKGQVTDTFTKYSNYICTDSKNCNENISDLQRLNDFFERVTH